MARPRMRPRFEVVVPGLPDRTMHRIKTRLARADGPCNGRIVGRHLVLGICEAERRFWSPRLEVEVVAHGDATLLRGLMGPHPSLWSLFVACYAVLGFLGVTGVLFGFSQWMLGTPAYAWWSVPASLVLGAGVYAAALLGQRLGADQMDELRAFLDQLTAET